MGRKVTFDTEKAIELLKSGIKQKVIAKELNIPGSTLRMFYKRNAGEQLKKIKEQKKAEIKDDVFVLEHSDLLSIDDLKEIKDEKSYGILPNESIGDHGFLMMNIQSYKLNKNGKKLIFDESRGKRTYAVPKSY